MAKGRKNRKFSVNSRSARLRRRKPTSHYQLKQSPPSKFTIYHEEPKKRFFSGRTIEHHAYRIAIVVIVFAFCSVFASLIFMLDHPPERQVKDQIDDLAINYYEEIFYPKLTSSESFDGNLEKALSKYVGNGLSRVYLRQFLLLEDIDESTASFIKRYCNENSTFVRFFPEPPYAKDSYHTEVTYSCNFE